MSEFNTDNIDRFGHCVVCHKNMITKRVVDGQVLDMFTPDHGHTEFLLSNGSKMQVCICNKCKDNIDLTAPAIQSNIMRAVNKGWELETKMLVEDPAYPDWTEEFGKRYLKNMAKLNIDCHSEEIDNNVINDRIKKLTEAKNVSN